MGITKEPRTNNELMKQRKRHIPNKLRNILYHHLHNVHHVTVSTMAKRAKKSVNSIWSRIHWAAKYFDKKDYLGLGYKTEPYFRTEQEIGESINLGASYPLPNYVILSD